MKGVLEKKKPVNPDNVTIPELDGKGVLIVEDDPSERSRAEKAVSKLGYLPFTVDNYLRASRALGMENFLFVLTDLHYPCCSGSNISVPEQGLPQPNGITLAVDVKMKGGKVAILTSHYHHGSVEWASNLCSLLEIPFFDTTDEWDTDNEDKGKKKWSKAIQTLRSRSSAILELVE